MDADPIGDLLDSAASLLRNTPTQQPPQKPAVSSKKRSSSGAATVTVPNNFAEFVQRLKKEIKRLRSELAKKDEQLMQLEEQNKTLKTVLAEPVVPKDQHDNQVEIFNQTIDALAKENFQLKSQIIKLQAQLVLATSDQPPPVLISSTAGASASNPPIAATQHDEAGSGTTEQAEQDLEEKLRVVTNKKDVLEHQYHDLLQQIDILQKQRQNDEAIIARQQTALKEYAQSQSDTRTLSQDVRRLKRENEQLQQSNLTLEESLQYFVDKVENLTVVSKPTPNINEPKPIANAQESNSSTISTTINKFSKSSSNRTPEQQLTLDKALRTKFPALGEDENVIEWYSCARGYLYLTTTWLCFDPQPLAVGRDSYKVLQVSSVNKTTSGWVRLPTLEIRLDDGTVKSYSGLLHRNEAMAAIKEQGGKLGHTVQLYDAGIRIEDPAQ